MKTAAEYAEQTEENLMDALVAIEAERLAEAEIYALIAGARSSLAQAAATLEAAALTTQVQRDSLLAALAEPEPAPSAYCSQEWSDKEATVARQHAGFHGGPSSSPLHRCIYAPGHEHEEPHYCLCGSEL